MHIKSLGNGVETTSHVCGYPMCTGNAILCTVKLVLAYKDHPWDQQDVVLIHRWSLYAGSTTWIVYHWRPVKCGLYKQVVSGAGLAVTA